MVSTRRDGTAGSAGTVVLQWRMTRALHCFSYNFEKLGLKKLGGGEQSRSGYLLDAINNAMADLAPNGRSGRGIVVPGA